MRNGITPLYTYIKKAVAWINLHLRREVARQEEINERKVNKNCRDGGRE